MSARTLSYISLCILQPHQTLVYKNRLKIQHKAICVQYITQFIKVSCTFGNYLYDLYRQHGVFMANKV